MRYQALCRSVKQGFESPSGHPGYGKYNCANDPLYPKGLQSCLLNAFLEFFMFVLVFKCLNDLF